MITVGSGRRAPVVEKLGGVIVYRASNTPSLLSILTFAVPCIMKDYAFDRNLGLQTKGERRIPKYRKVYTRLQVLG